MRTQSIRMTVLILLCLTPLAAQTAEDAGRAASQTNQPTYPIAGEVYTTLDRTNVILPHDPVVLMPKQISEYAANHYGEWNANGPGYPYLKPDLATGVAGPSTRDPQAASLLSFFSISDVHVVDKESPAQVLYLGYENQPGANSSAYSGVILFTPHVLDAAVQTINVLHRKTPFDFGIGLGDAANNTEYNETRWYIDVIDGQWITPSSGAHLGAETTLYQKPFQAAGLDKSLPWRQAIGNHDQFWMGSASVNDYLRQTFTGPDILNLGPQTPPTFDFNTRGLYMGVVDGTTEYGDVIDAGPTSQWPVPPQIVADQTRRSLLQPDWMSEFLISDTLPSGHGFTQTLVRNDFACYSFYPRANVPLKVIVLDDTDKVGGGADASLDYQRYGWLVDQLDAGEAAGELMIICAHIPILPYAQGQAPTEPPFPLDSMWSPQSDVSEQTVLDKLHTYKNLILWVAGHVHRNCITPQPDPGGNPENGFWEVETPSLRDFPQQFRRFEIVRNSDNTISIFALDIDPAVNWTPLADGSSSPAWTSRSYAIAASQIFLNTIANGPYVDAGSGVYNAELVKTLSPLMQAKLAALSPVVDAFQIAANSDFATDPAVTLNNTVTGSVPAEYLASEAADFAGAVWRPYNKAPNFTLSSLAAPRTVYFKVRDGSGRESAVVSDTFSAKPQIQGVVPTSAMVNTNNRAILAVRCTGGQPLSFQWYAGASGDTSAPVAGATQVVFTTPRITADTKFWVRASNAFGHADSPAVPVVLWNRYYVPHAAAGDGWWSRLSLVNADGASSSEKAVPADWVNISAYSGGGVLLETRTVTVKALNRFTADICDLFNPETLAEDIWLKIESKAELKGLAEFGATDLAAQSALPFQEDPEKVSEFPYVVTLENWYTGITLVNTASDEEAYVRLSAYSEVGLKLAEKLETIAPNGKYTRLVAEIFSPGCDPSAIRNIVVDSSQPLVGFELFGNTVEKGVAGLPIIPQPTTPTFGPTYSLLYPEVPDRADWYTGVTFVNQAEGETSVAAEAYDAAGTWLGTEAVPLLPHQQLTREVGTLFASAQYASMAYFQLSAPQRLSGFEVVLSRFGPFRFDGLQAIGQPAERQLFLLAPADALMSTNLRLINEGPNPLTLTVKAFGADGASLGVCPVALSAHAKRELDVLAAIPTIDPIAWLLVEADSPFAASAFVLSGDNQRLVMVVGQPLP